MTSEKLTLETEEQLSKWLGDSENNGRVVSTILKTDSRVIARVTDGIYRQPASALRELISNAWDADARNVTILTDVPRFSRIYVRDDGNGMDHATLTRLLHHIGGSSKRREEGQELGVSSAVDADKSPSGRPLIGKIGIGLFSISQLARHFTIVTKVKGANFRLVADVRIRDYSEDGSDLDDGEETDDHISGIVDIRRELSDDPSSHGTDIIVDRLKRPVRDILRSAARWEAVDEFEKLRDSEPPETVGTSRTTPPVYHTGYIEKLDDDGSVPSILSRPQSLPWSTSDPASVRMAKLVDAVEQQSGTRDRPDLAGTLDTYLEMVWSLGLSAPVDYLEVHPFDLKQNGDFRLFWLERGRGSGSEVVFDEGATVREAVQKGVKGNPELQAGAEDPLGGFTVNIDGMELKRPIRFKFRQTGPKGLEKAVLFVGRHAPDLSRVSKKIRGGGLELEAYLFWTGRVIPKEHNGVLFRIRGASGALFDSTFVGYQVSELTRLKQISSEFFIHKGLDAALNIDRETFNYSHPHFSLVTKWLHGAIKQLTNRLKEDAKHLRNTRRIREADEDIEKILRRSSEIWAKRRGDEPEPDVLIAGTEVELRAARSVGQIALPREIVDRGSQRVARRVEPRERAAQAEALLQVLSAFDLLDDLDYQEQDQLLSAIFDIFYGVDDDQ